ncbi:hypothetical protein B9Z55_006188 [Caenorhabditis nigoni]|uniref:Uncharacterized protein n=1 Tax=Caenorhabditis nigoni TaxID=1611254 RepID=A0A2G5V414_9PELO|nr:hypothetical protein B9Z55_006188 [Caenorhabditis nigoni]
MKLLSPAFKFKNSAKHEKESCTSNQGTSSDTPEKLEENREDAKEQKKSKEQLEYGNLVFGIETQMDNLCSGMSRGCDESRCKKNKEDGCFRSGME